jgi:hypothetical protein
MVRAAQDARTRGIYMTGRWRQWSWSALAGILCLALATAASAQVVVTVNGDTADATISLTDGNGVTYDADVTIVFDTPEYLTPRSLNLTAELVDPNAIRGRLPGSQLCLPIIGCVVVDPAFPVMITVEPIDFPSLYTSSFETGEGRSVDLSFLNTYQFDVHTHDLSYQPNSVYRLMKAPVDPNQPFHDVTNDVMPGSVRVRGRGGAFSQFLVVKDTRIAATVAAEKIVLLNLRILSSVLDDGLRLDLLALLAQVDALLLIDLTGALDNLAQLIGLIDENAGTNIANVWTAQRDVANDAGEMDELALTLQFTMLRMLGGGANP